MKLIVDLYCEVEVRAFLGWLTSSNFDLPVYLEVSHSDIDVSAMCIDLDLDQYLILINSTNRSVPQVICTLAHEMIHMRQYMNQDLGRFLDMYSDTPYHERWWEIQARDQSRVLIEQYIQHVKDIRNEVDDSKGCGSVSSSG